MRNKKKFRPPPGQIPLFDVLEEIQEKIEAKEGNIEMNPGSMNISVQLRNELSEGLKMSMLSRHQVAARMSELTGAEITKSQLDSWTAESKEYHRFPAEYLPAFCFVTGYKKPLMIMARMVQCYLMESEGALLAELGKIDQGKKDLAMRERTVLDLISRMKGTKM